MQVTLRLPFIFRKKLLITTLVTSIFNKMPPFFLDLGLLKLCIDTSWGPILLKCRLWFITFGEGLKFCISDKLSVDAVACSSCTTFWVGKPEPTHWQLLYFKWKCLKLGKSLLWSLLGCGCFQFQNHEERLSNDILSTWENRSYIPGYSLFYVILLSDFLTYVNSEATFFISL